MPNFYIKINEVFMNISIPQRSGQLAALLLTGMLTLAGCGGADGGGSGDSSTGASTVTADSGVDAAQGMQDLVIARSNELAAVTELNTEVQMIADRSYLSVCPDSGGEIAVTSLDYDSCLLRSPLDAGTRTFTLSLPNHVDRLVAIIWFYEAGKQPLIQRWQRNGGGGVATAAYWRILETP
jgi:hypothetical protein